MTAALEPDPSGIEINGTGPTLQRARMLSGRTASESARAVGVTRRELRDVERGRRSATVDLVDRAVRAYGGDELALPRRRDLVHPEDPTLLLIGTDSVRVDPCRTSDREVLERYVAAVRRQRGIGVGEPVPFRSHDLVQLAGVLDLASEDLDSQLRDVVGMGPGDSLRTVRMLVLTGLCLAVAGATWDGIEPAERSTLSRLADRPTVNASQTSWLSRDQGRSASSVMPSLRLEALAELMVNGRASSETGP